MPLRLKVGSRLKPQQEAAPVRPQVPLAGPAGLETGSTGSAWRKPARLQNSSCGGALQSPTRAKHAETSAGKRANSRTWNSALLEADLAVELKLLMRFRRARVNEIGRRCRRDAGAPRTPRPPQILALRPIFEQSLTISQSRKRKRAELFVRAIRALPPDPCFSMARLPG